MQILYLYYQVGVAFTLARRCKIYIYISRCGFYHVHPTKGHGPTRPPWWLTKMTTDVYICTCIPKLVTMGCIQNFGRKGDAFFVRLQILPYPLHSRSHDSTPTCLVATIHQPHTHNHRATYTPRQQHKNTPHA